MPPPRTQPADPDSGSQLIPSATGLRLLHQTSTETNLNLREEDMTSTSAEPAALEGSALTHPRPLQVPLLPSSPVGPDSPARRVAPVCIPPPVCSSRCSSCLSFSPRRTRIPRSSPQIFAQRTAAPRAQRLDDRGGGGTGLDVFLPGRSLGGATS